jgi:hypothetical protein
MSAARLSILAMLFGMPVGCASYERDRSPTETRRVTNEVQAFERLGTPDVIESRGGWLLFSTVRGDFDPRSSSGSPVYLGDETWHYLDRGVSVRFDSDAEPVTAPLSQETAARIHPATLLTAEQWFAECGRPDLVTEHRRGVMIVSRPLDDSWMKLSNPTLTYASKRLHVVLWPGKHCIVSSMSEQNAREITALPADYHLENPAVECNGMH